MRFLLATLLTATLSFLAGLFLPWWSLAIVAFLVALLVPQRLAKGFAAGFLGLFLLWGGLALFIDIKNKSLLSHKMASVLPLGGNQYLLLLVTAVVGGVVAGFAALSGSSLRQPARRRVVK